MKKVIVTTTINPPTEAIRRFERLTDWELIVIGDLKTPANYDLHRGTFVSPQDQEKYDKDLSDAIGWNCIQRRNFGLLLAYDRGAEVIAVVDDDNIPHLDWGADVKIGREIEVTHFETDLPAFDPVGATEYRHLWHRGYPLQLLPKRNYSAKSTRRITPDVQACFWNGDPDIDAICRMEHSPVCRFREDQFPMASNKPAPFNSQNTLLSRSILRDYFLFPGIGRMDDIWAAYYLQAKGASVIFDRATVDQERNEHDLVRDMQQEYIGYEKNLKLILELADDPERIENYLPERSWRAFELYRRHF
ncbi:MAG: hypothetical protein FJ403_07090 [Verrucomicrobia bacterium]|nr:hypothetical protein [Verrucomicrobiota bacterium]